MSPLTQNTDRRAEIALTGAALYGDDFSASEIAAWFEDEREGYFDLYYGNTATAAAQSEEEYGYRELAKQHGFDWLPAQRVYRHALGIGSATGAELDPVLDRSERVTVLEPSDGFATAERRGKPVRYVKPAASGLMPFDDHSFDLIVCFSVLHHIPNVSTVLREMHRVLRPGGHVLLREPTCSMGDWRQPRRGLTKRERGIPLKVFRHIVQASGLQVVAETRCNFALMSRLQPLLKQPVWSLPWAVTLDAWLCRLAWWPERYHATRTWHKLRPISVAYVLERPLAP